MLVNVLLHHLHLLPCTVEDYDLIGPKEYNGKDNTTSDKVHIYPLINVHHFHAHMQQKKIEEHIWLRRLYFIWDFNTIL